MPAAVMAAPAGTAMAKILACGVWLAWLVFAACLAAEVHRRAQGLSRAEAAWAWHRPRR